MYSLHTIRVEIRQLNGHGGAKVSALADVLLVPDHFSDQLVPKLSRRDRLDRFFRHRRKAEARQRRNYQRERVFGLGTVFRWLGEWPDDVQKFQDRAGPAVRKHKRQGMITFAFNVVELDIKAVYAGHVLRVPV